nr:hypothetical protein [Tanacetum cinerariifolium]
MLVPQQVADDVANVAADDVEDVVAKDDAEPTSPSPTPPPPQEIPSTLQNLEQDKIAQALKITKLKQRLRRLEKRNKVKASWLKRLKKVGAAKRIESSADTIMDDQEDASKQGGEIAKLDAYEDVILEDVASELEKDAKVAKDPAELKEVIEVVTTAKLITKVVTAASTITVVPSVARRRKRVVIRDPKETATPSTIVYSEPKSRDRGKGILVEEPKPLKKQAQIEQDEAYLKELEAELNKNINWDDMIEQMILPVERRYPLTRFTLDQMLNNVRLEVEEKSKVSLMMLRFVRRQQQEGYRPEYILHKDQAG